MAISKDVSEEDGDVSHSKAFPQADDHSPLSDSPELEYELSLEML